MPTEEEWEDYADGLRAARLRPDWEADMNPKLNRSRGKRAERVVAKILKGRRMGTMGNEDVDTGLFSVEVKSRKKFVGDGFMSQAIANCYPGKLPLVVVHTHGRRHTEDLVILRMKDFEGLYGNVKVKGD